MMRSRVCVAVALASLCAAMAAARAASEPRALHIALGADAQHTATITWFTDGLDDPGTALEYGPTEELGRQAMGTTEKAAGVSVLVHVVRLTGLDAGARTYYRVWGTQDTHSFTTAPAGCAPFTFTLFSDHGTFPTSGRTVEAAIGQHPDLQLMAGDLSYANGTYSKWDRWFDSMAPLAADVPLMVAPGNHELENASLASYRSRFALPGDEVFYSFDYANVHFLMLTSDRSSNTNEAIFPGMVAFAEEDLRDAALRKQAGAIDFIVVVQHHPLYGSMSSGAPDAQLERQMNPFLISWEEPLLHRYGVDLVLAAHNHHYERTTPMAFNQATSSEKHSYAAPYIGFIEMISGGGGESMYSFRDPNDVGAWSVARARRYHLVRFDVDGKTLTATAIATDEDPDLPGILDSFTITAA